MMFRPVFVNNNQLPKMKKYTSGLLALTLALAANSMVASTIDILWYVAPSTPGGTNVATYEADMLNLAAQELNPLFNVSGSINTWNITFWDGTLTKPAGVYDVLVGGSNNGSGSYASLTSAVNASDFGSRVMLTGQDADFHYHYGRTGSAAFDGPAGFLIDAINWAGSGTGMGGVLLGLSASTAINFTGETGSGASDNTVNIPGAYATYPINTGLTSAGLSNWGTSSHDQFTISDSSLWTAINTGGAGENVTIVSAESASGGTTVPDATATVGLLGMGFMLLAGFKRRVA